MTGSIRQYAPSRFSLFLALSLSFFTPVASHGWASNANIDGVDWPGLNVLSPDWSQPTAIRVVSTQDPLQDVNSGALTCGIGAQPAPLEAPANPGSVIKFRWASAPDVQDKWPHEWGSALTYIAPCGQSCITLSAEAASNLEWIKIQEAGLNPDGTWIQKSLMDNAWATIDATLPDYLPEGSYLVRNELISLHNGAIWGEAQFYEACLQIRLSAPRPGVNAHVPAGVRLPGEYRADDPGILANPWGLPDGRYTPPGPRPVSLHTDGNAPPNPPQPQPQPSATTTHSSSPPSETPNGGNGNGNTDGDDDNNDTTLCRPRGSRKVRRATRPRVWASRRHRAKRQHS